MRRRKGSKKKAIRKHSRIRAAERYDVFVDRSLRRKIINSIKKHGPFAVVFVSKQSNRVKIWDVVVEEKTLRVVYDKNRHEIITFLPIKEEPKQAPLS